MMEKKIEMVHFQITRNCNLRCHFCGQWGKKGFFSDASGKNMTFDDWKNVVDQLDEYKKENNTQVDITVWGGEPLVSPYFDEIVNYLHDRNYKIAIITNGVLIDKHLDVIKNCVDKIYLSIDGTREIHDHIRGSGTFDKVVDNIKILNHHDVTVMSVITEGLVNNLKEYLLLLNELNIKNLYLQDMIGLESDEISDYQSWLKNAFEINAIDINSWANNDVKDFGEQIDSILVKTDLTKFNYEIIHKTHFENDVKTCLSPFKHIHIAWNGNVLYCTDFYDFFAGNVKEEKLIEIYNNKLSEKFREEISKNHCITCKHCSWRNNETFRI